MISENIKKMKELSSNLIIQFNKLDKRKKTLIIILIGVLFFNIVFNNIYKPQKITLRKFKLELDSLKNSSLNIREDIPNVEREKKLLEVDKARLQNLEKEISIIEGQLPQQSSLPNLLGELIKIAAQDAIDFISIKPATTKKDQDYAKLDIEIKFNSSYVDLANYLRRLKNMSEFLNVKDIVIEEMKDGFNSNLTVTLILSTLLGDSISGNVNLNNISTQSPQMVKSVNITRDPFISGYIPNKDLKESEAYKLSGVVFKGRMSTAIINDNVYRVGDVIDKYTIAEILPNLVVLSDGRRDIVLTLDFQE